MAITPIDLTLRNVKGSALTATENDANLTNLKTASEELDAELFKNNLSAAVAPTTTDDSSSDYAVGSRWIDTTADKEYVCLDATATAAVWKETTSSAGGGDLLSTNNLSDVASATTSRTNLGLTIGVDVQGWDAGLNSISGLTTLADRMIYTTAADTYAVATLTAAGRALLDDADASAQRTTLGLIIGTDVQAYDVNITIQGNTFNGVSQLIQTDGTGKYPALDGSLITNLSSGFADPMTTRGDIIIRDAANATARLGIGTNGQALISNGTDIAWATPAGGGDLLSTNNLSDLTNFTTARSNLGLVIGVNVQAYDVTNVLDADVTYELLNTNGDVGTGVSQLAIGNHTHTGVYEPADATILKDADIGSTVQAYDADTAKTDVAQIFTAAQRTSTTAGDNSIAFNDNNNHTFTATAANVTVTNQTVGQGGTIVITTASNITGWGTEFDWGNAGVPTGLGALETFAYYISGASGVDSIKIGRL